VTRWAAINYRDFWDFPHIFILTDGGRTYLFDCPFDDVVEDYPDEFHVYLMPPLAAEEIAGSWVGLYRKAIAELGRVPTSAVRFDPTKRQFVDASVLDTFTAGAASAPG
jgi:hypothetical protein